MSLVFQPDIPKKKIVFINYHVICFLCYNQKNSEGLNMKLLDQYFELQQELYEYFGYKEDWVVIPLDDGREYYWTLFEDEDGSGFVNFADTVEKLQDRDAGEYYQYSIYQQRFLPKWVYRGEKYTMISVNTHVDGNKFLQIFDNAKEIKETED